MAIGELLLLGTLASANPTTHTSLADVRDCVPATSSEDWIVATEGGLARVDALGRVRTRLDAASGMPGTRVLTLVSDPQDPTRLWVGAESGVARVEVTASGLELERTWSSRHPVRALAPHGEDWVVALWEGGLAHLKPDAPGDTLASFVPKAASEQPLRVTSLHAQAGVMWAGTAGRGLWRAPTDQLDELAPVDDAQLGRFVWEVSSRDEKVLVADMDGLHQHGGETLLRGDLRDLDLAGDGWVAASMGEGLLGDSAGPPVAHLQAVATAGERRCVGTSEGLWLRSEQGQWSQHLDGGLPDQDVSAIAIDDTREELWVGTFDGGLARFADGRWTLPKLEGTRIDRQINALELSRDGQQLVIGTARGLFRLDIESGSVEHWDTKEGLPGRKVLSLHAARDGSMLVGTDRGPMRLVGKELHQLGERVRPWAVWAIAEETDDEGQLTVWLGTTQGLIAWYPDRVWRHFSVLSGHLRDNWITSLHRHENELFVGTYARGVTRLRREDRNWRARHFGGGRINPHGLDTDDAGTLFASTMEGLLRLPAGSKTWEQVDGLPGIDVTASLSDRSGQRWVSTRRGLARLTSRRVK